MHLDPDRLMLLALGDEPADADVLDHLAACHPCREEYESLRDTVDLDYGSDRPPDVPAPPPRVWDGIMRQILAESQLLSDSEAAAIAGPTGQRFGRDVAPVARGATDDAIGRWPVADRSDRHQPTPPRSGRRRADAAPRPPGASPRRSRESAPPAGPEPGRGRRIGQAAALAAAIAVIAVAGTLGIVALRGGDGTTLLSRANLAAQPEAPAGAHGSAEVVRVGAATELRLTLSGMPAPEGYYEAWLFDPVTGGTYAMGPVTAAGGTVTVTGVDLRRYTGVDVSAQPMDGDGDHGQSMLRGALE